MAQAYRDPRTDRVSTAGTRRPPEDDVAAARANVHHAHVAHAHGTARRPRRITPADRVQNFVHRYGWRAYALPILFVVTVAALISTGTATAPVRAQQAAGPAPGGGGGQAVVAAPPTAGSQLSLKNDTGGNRISDTVLKASQLPAGDPYTKTGTGTFRVLKGTTPKVGSGQLFRYSIDVENGVKGVDLAEYQKLVDTTLDAKRSWSGHGVTLQRVDSGPIDFHVTLTSSMTVRKYCGYDIPVETSCYQQAGSVAGLDANRVLFNVSRWVRGSAAYVADLTAYRTYMINHEVGHALGHQHAHQCLPGGLAPAMMQQTFGLRSTATGRLCQANPWPYPVTSSGAAVAGAPGAEQPDTAANTEYGRGD